MGSESVSFMVRECTYYNVGHASMRKSDTRPGCEETIRSLKLDRDTLCQVVILVLSRCHSRVIDIS